MKVTMFMWDRREGKTTRLVELAHAGKDVLFLVHNYSEGQRLKKEYYFELRDVDIQSYNKTGVECRLRGKQPKLIIVDNAEMVDPDVFRTEIEPLAMRADEIVLAGSHMVFLNFIAPEVAKTKYVTLRKRTPWKQYWMNHRKICRKEKNCKKYGGGCPKDNNCPALENPRGGDFGWGECIYREKRLS